MNAAEYALTDVAKARGLDPDEFLASVKEASKKMISETEQPEVVEEEVSLFINKDTLPSMSINQLRAEARRKAKSNGRPNRAEQRFYDRKNKTKAKLELQPLEMLESAISSRNINTSWRSST